MKIYTETFQSPQRALIIKDKVYFKGNDNRMLILQTPSAENSEFKIKQKQPQLPYKSDSILRISSPFFRCKNTHVKTDDETGLLSFAEQLQVSTKNCASVYDED